MKKLFTITLILILFCSVSFAQAFIHSYGTGIPSDEIASKEFVEQAVGGNLLYHGSTTPSDISGYSTLNDVATSTLTNGTYSSVGTDWTQQGKSLTIDGQPNLSIMPAGLAFVKVTAMSSGKDVYIMPTLWSRTSAGVVTQIATSTEGLITSTKSTLLLYMTIANDVFLDPTDRIFMSMYTKATGAPAPDVTIYFGGDDDTSVAFPAPSEAFARTNGNSNEDFSANNINAAGIGDFSEYIRANGLVNKNSVAGNGTKALYVSYSNLAPAGTSSTDFNCGYDGQILVEATLSTYSGSGNGRAKKVLSSFYIDKDASITTPETTDIYDVGAGATVIITWTWVSDGVIRATITNTDGSLTAYVPCVEYKFYGQVATHITN
jgi:hypothetical protein